MRQKIYIEDGIVKEDAFIDHVKARYNRKNLIDQIEMDLLDDDLNGRAAEI